MLNISKHNSVDKHISTDKYKSFSMVKNYRSLPVFARLMTYSLALFLIILFLPWTQFVRSNGNVTVLKPENRPQTIQAIIDGRIEKWYVQEGDSVKKGDTIIFISEIKEDYLDPELLSRSQMQIKAKQQSVQAYTQKASALDIQIAALKETRDLKIKQANNYVQQAKLKIKSDSIDLLGSETNLEIAFKQMNRAEELYDEGLKSLTQLEEAKLKYQQATVKKISAENKLLESKNQLINARVELNAIKNEYGDKLAKAEADKFATLSQMYESEGEVAKMENQYSNYAMRAGLYYITAPRDGMVTRAIRAGIGEAVNKGEPLVNIIPDDYQQAVEMYVSPVDLPLISKGQKVRLMFDGWPTVVFAGWPDLSYGTFGGKVIAIENVIDQKGKFRVLVAPDPEDKTWPDALSMGSGAVAMTMLKNVPIWYEIWRKLNGFPADFYQNTDGDVGDSKNEKETKNK